MSISARRSILLVSAIACYGLPLSAQQPASSSLSGTVTDAVGAALQRANVSLHSADNRVTRRTITDATGHFTLSGLPDGRFEVDADAPGFALGVQWHAEHDPQTNPVNRALFQAFGEAVAAYRRRT